MKLFRFSQQTNVEAAHGVSLAMVYGTALYLLLTLSSAYAAPLSPGAVISPIDKPVFQPTKNTTPTINSVDKSAPAPSSEVKVKVNDFQFVGNTTYSDEVLIDIIARYKGRVLSISQIYNIADIVEVYYRYHGYLLTSVYVPAQKINTGTIKFEVIEGRVGEIKMQGELSSYSETFLLNQVDDLQTGKVIDDNTLEQETLLLGDLPGLETRAVVKPGKTFGTSDIIFINEEDQYSGAIGVNNFGRKAIGNARVEAGLLIANPLFQGDALNLSGIIAQDSRMLFARADYDALLNTSGTRAGFNVSVFDYDVDTVEAGLAAGNLEGSGISFMARISHPIERTSRSSTKVSVAVRRSTTKEDGSLALASRRKNTINLLEVVVDYERNYNDNSKTSVRGGLSTNFKSVENVEDRDSQKAKLQLDVSHYQPFNDTWFFIGRVQAAYSPDPLVDLERFRIGGPGSVRAYPSAEMAGDKGGVLSLDVGVNYNLSSDVTVTPKVFADAGKVSRYDDFGLFGLPASDSLAGYGIGMTISFAKIHSIDMEVVTPSSDNLSSDGRDTRFWLNYRGLL